MTDTSLTRLRAANPVAEAPVIEALDGVEQVVLHTGQHYDERMSQVFFRDLGLPEPEVNAWVTPPDGERAIRVDFLWRTERLIVETDGYRTHKTRQAFEHDRRNDQRLMAASFNVIRPTWRQIRDEPGRLQQTIASLLAPQAA